MAWLNSSGLVCRRGLVACELASRVGLDFDDGLQYYYAKKLGASIISFDKDFDKTDLKRLEPASLLESLRRT